MGLTRVVESPFGDWPFLILTGRTEVLRAWRSLALPLPEATKPPAIDFRWHNLRDGPDNRAAHLMACAEVRMLRQKLPELVDALSMASDGPVNLRSELDFGCGPHPHVHH